jgi:micrococcal nuclease
MRRYVVLIVRWILGILFLVAGVERILRFPIPASLAVALSLVLMPITEKMIFKALKMKPNKWIKLGVVVVILFFFRISVLTLPSQGTPQLSPSPVATESAVVASHSASLLPSPPAQSASPSAEASSSAQLYKVTKVVDGDTFKVEIDGKVETVRIVGVNTPETVDPRREVQCFGKEASARATTLLKDQSVSLEQDTTQQNRDRYGRLLRFAFLSNGSDVGLTLIKEGYAEEALYSTTPHKYHQQYVNAEASAKAEKRGLWADTACLVEEQ